MSCKLANPPAKTKRSNRLPSPKNDPIRSKSGRSKSKSLSKHANSHTGTMKAAVEAKSSQSDPANVTIQPIDQHKLILPTVAALHALEVTESGTVS